MNVKININKNKVKSKIENGIKAMRIALSEQILDYSENLIPTAENALRDSGITSSIPEKGLLIWNTKYAKYQWYGMREDGSHVVKKYTTPGTGTMWAQKAVDNNKKELQQVAQNAFEKGMS